MTETPQPPAFSVIVPVYNEEEYVAECLDSILGQTFTDFELIAIDDGSTDGSAAILDTYAAKDARLRVIHQENGGLSAARNTGLAAALGQYCLFVDSDDVIHPQLLEVCRYFLQKYDADLISFGYTNIAPHAGLPHKRLNPASLSHHSSRSPLPLLAHRNRHHVSLMAPLSCCRTELERRHPFKQGMLYEDYPRTTCMMKDVRLVITLRASLYGYTTRPGSIMRKQFSTKNIEHYQRGLLCIADSYADLPNELMVVSRIIYPEILKQIGNSIFRAKCSAEERREMLLIFQKLLLELATRGLLRWRGHKLRRYLAYRRIARTEEQGLHTLIPRLSKVFH